MQNFRYEIMEKILRSAFIVAWSSKGNPVKAVATVILFHIMFTVVEVGVERLIFGERFEHWLDAIFSIAFIAYAGLTVFACYIYNSEN